MLLTMSGTDSSSVARTKHKLRDLRRLERRFRSLPPESDDLVWSRYFAVTEGERARYPLLTLAALDRESRRRIIQEYLTDVFLSATGRVGSPERQRLLSVLGLEPGASQDDIRRRFRQRAKELHPDLGGDNHALVELLSLYRGGTSDS